MRRPHVPVRSPSGRSVPGRGIKPCHSLAVMGGGATRREGTTQAERRAEYVAAEQLVKDQVLARDGCCILCGTRSRPNVQHCLPRGMGGTRFPLDPRLAVVLHGSGTTGCHGAVERLREDWTKALGYLLTHGATLDRLRDDPDATRLVWYHHERVWKELFVSGVAVMRAELEAPPPPVLHAVDDAVAGHPW
jgi:hypothetical protein